MRTSIKAFGIFVLVLFGTLASGAAMAQRGGHGYYGHGYGYGGGVRFGISLGFPIYGPGYYPAPYYAYPYAYPAYTYPAPAYAYPAPAYAYPAPAMATSPAYVEQNLARPAPAQAQGDWYYCPASKSYYPYANECPSGWQRVPAQPPSH